MKTKSFFAAMLAAVSFGASAPVVVGAEVQLAGGPLCVANRCPHKVVDPSQAPTPMAAQQQLAGGVLCVANRCPYRITSDESLLGAEVMDV